MSKFSEKYNATFSQLRTDVQVELEPVLRAAPARRAKHRVLAIAIAACLLAALSVTAYATNGFGLFGLKDLALGAPSTISVPVVSEAPDGQTVYTETSTPQQMISLQGLPDSKEYQAAAEWNAFRESYDTDHAILNQVGNGISQPIEYADYGSYSQEMTDKLDEICAKYGLKLRGDIAGYQTKDELLSLTASGDFLGENHVLSGYVYPAGTFQFDSDKALPDGTTFSYQFRNCEKGVFDEVYLNIGDLTDYTEWSYTTACGVTVDLAQSAYKSLILAETGTSFVVVNIMTGTAFDDMTQTAGGISPADLQAFADSFDFTQVH